MDDAAAADASPRSRARSPQYGRIGLALAVLGLAAVIAGPFVDEAVAPPPRPLSQELADAARRLMGRKPKPAEAKPAPRPALAASWYCSVAGAALGVLATSAGVAGWVGREDARTAASAVAAGLGVVAWMYFQQNFGAALAVALVYVVLLVVLALLSA